jgi:excinuclease ABC subunit A
VFFDPSRVVAFPALSLASGAIKGWDQRNSFYFALLQSLAAHYRFDIEQAFEDLPEKVKKVVLYGSGEEDIRFDDVMESGGGGKKASKKHPFEGIIPNMQRRYQETDSTAVRETLAALRSTAPCPECGGSRLRLEARHVKIGEGDQARAIFELNRYTLAECLAYFNTLHMHGVKGDIAARIVREINLRLKFLNDVGLPYLSLDRSAETLSGGESQRIRLASQIGSGLTGVMYVLDEPSIGLHQRDNARLIDTLKHLRDIGNSVLVVEHDEDMMRAADHIIDLGPGAGVHGGYVTAQGTFDEIKANTASLTGQYLAHTLSIEVPKKRTVWLPCVNAPTVFEKPKPSRFAPSPAALRRAEREALHKATQGELQAIKVIGAIGHNLKNIDVAFPVGLFTCVTGVSGSGKSTLVNDTLYKAVAQTLYKAHDEPAPHTAIEGIEYFDKVINVDQSPIGRTPRSNPATYTGLFTPIRELMADVPTARERGYGPGRFSFNVSQSSGGGRCEACEGDGVVKVEMHFLSDVYVLCDICAGKRYNRETLEVMYKGKNIAQILDLTVEAAYDFFKAVPTIERKLRTLLDVGLSYIRLGQSATTLSGGEAQRVKLALELSKRDTGRTLYILDEPTTGLHFADIALLLKVLHQLRDAGNTIVVIEHNLDVIKTADWLIDMGLEGGSGGGTVVGVGTPETLAALTDSHTGNYLARLLGK